MGSLLFTYKLFLQPLAAAATCKNGATSSLGTRRRIGVPLSVSVYCVTPSKAN